MNNNLRMGNAECGVMGKYGARRHSQPRLNGVASDIMNDEIGMNFLQQLRERAGRLGSALCVGLDPVVEKLPEGLPRTPEGVLQFTKAIVASTAQHAVCFKPNSAFYEALGEAGHGVLRATIDACHEHGAPVILDAKRGDIGSTAQLYARAAFERLDADAITINAYLGLDGVKPFRDYTDRCSFILCYTSNPSRVDIQTRTDSDGTPLYMHMASCIAAWNGSDGGGCGNLGAVVGATAPAELTAVRGALGPDAPILCPGVGAQGGDLEASMRAGMASPKHAGSLIVNASRGISQASSGTDYAEAAGKAAAALHEAMMPLMG